MVETMGLITAFASGVCVAVVLMITIGLVMVKSGKADKWV